MSMDVTLQRQDLVAIADRASNFRDSLLRLRTDENKLIVSATGRSSPEDPISKVVPDTLLPAVVLTPGTANGDPAELARQARALTAVRTRLVAISVWPGFELSGIDPSGSAQPMIASPVAVPDPLVEESPTPAPVSETPEPAAPPTPSARPATFDMSPHVAALVAADAIRIRKPWTVPLFGVFTLGIYLFVWYYRINRELRDLGAVSGEPGRALDVKPGRSTLAVSLGAILLIPLFVSINRTLHRIQNAERLTQAPEPDLSRGKAWGLFVLIIPFWTGYAQAHLNRIWLEQLRRSVPEHPTLVIEPAQEIHGDAPQFDTPPPDHGSELWPVLPPVAPPPPVLAPPPPPPPAPVPVPVLLPPLLAEPSPPLASVPPPVPLPTPEPIPPPVAAPPPPPPPVPAPPPPPPVVETPVSKPDIHDPAIETIRGRYARGEITRQEYREMLEDLA